MCPEDEDEWVGVDRPAPESAEEWVACTDVDALYWPLRLAVMAGPGVDRRERKWLLFAAGCCRQIAHFLTAPESQAAVEAAEALADGLLSAGALSRAEEAAAVAWRRLYDPTRPDYDHPPQMHAAIAATRLSPDTPDNPLGHSGPAHKYVVEALAAAAGHDPKDGDRWRGSVRGSRLSADLFRCVMGNPYRPIPFDPEWRTTTAVALARQMYETRDFSAMPILADALQDVGCDNEDILTHCRGAEPHVRGCWAIDLVLGLEAPPGFASHRAGV